MVAVAPASGAPVVAGTRRPNISTSGQVRAIGRVATTRPALRGNSIVPNASAETAPGTASTDGQEQRADRVVQVAFTMPGWAGEGTALLVGSGPLLGDWDPDVGRELRGCQRDPSGSPDAWTGLVKLPSNTNGEYKVVIRTSDKMDQWSQDDNAQIPVETVENTNTLAMYFTADMDATESGITTRDALQGGGIVPRSTYASSNLAKISFDDVLPKANPEAVLATVVFRATAKLQVGQRLVVVGNCPVLGYWRPTDSAAIMTWSENDVWTAAVKFDAFAVFGAIDQTSPAAWLDFKLVIMDDARGGVETWLDGDDFRVRRVAGTDAVATLNEWLSGEHYVATLGAPTPDGSGVVDLPGQAKEPSTMTVGSRDWCESVTVEIVGAGSAMNSTVSVGPVLGEKTERVEETKVEQVPEPAADVPEPVAESIPTPVPESVPMPTPEQPVAATEYSPESPESVLERLKAESPVVSDTNVSEPPAVSETLASDLELLSKATRVLENAAASVDEDKILEKAEQVIADVAAAVDEAQVEIAIPDVTLAFVQGPEDKARLARALRAFDSGGVPKVSSATVTEVPKIDKKATAEAAVNTTVEGNYAGGTMIKKAPKKKKKKGGFLWWNKEKSHDEEAVAEVTEVTETETEVADSVMYSFDKEEACTEVPVPTTASTDQALAELMDAEDDTSVTYEAPVQNDSLDETELDDFQTSKLNTVVFTAVGPLFFFFWRRDVHRIFFSEWRGD